MAEVAAALPAPPASLVPERTVCTRKLYRGSTVEKSLITTVERLVLVVRHPNGQQNHDDHTNGSTYETEFPVSGPAQTDRVSRSTVLHSLEEPIRHFGKRFVGHSP